MTPTNPTTVKPIDPHEAKSRYRALVKDEIIQATDIALYPIENTWRPVGGGAVGRPYEPNHHFAMRRRIKPPKPSPKPTKTEIDLAEARKLVKALEELLQVEVQIDSSTKGHRKTMADLRSKRDALKAQAYPKEVARKGKG